MIAVVTKSNIGQSIIRALEERGKTAFVVPTLREAVRQIAQGVVESLVVDASSVDIQALEVVMALPSCPPTVIIDPQDAHPEHIVAAMRLGVRDYFSLQRETPEQIAARLNEILASGMRDEANLIQLDPSRRVLKIGGQLVSLSNAESRLLKELLSNPNRVAPYVTLLGSVFEDGAGREDALELLRPHVARLRRKLETLKPSSLRLVNQRGQGYALLLEGKGIKVQIGQGEPQEQ